MIMRKALRGPEVSTHALSQQRLVSQQLLRRQHMSAPPVQSAVVEELRQLRDRVANDTTKLENVLVEFETQYHTAEYSQAGSVLKGFDGFLASKENLRKRARGYKPEDRLFSLSSRSSPASREADAAALEADPAGLTANKKMGGSHKGFGQKGVMNKQIKR